MGRLTTEKKIEIVKRRKTGEQTRKLAGEYGVSERQIQRWMVLYQKNGKSGLKLKSTKPKSSPNKLSKSVINRVIQCKKSNQYWRAYKISVELTNAGYSVSPPTVTKILEKEGINWKHTKTKTGYRRKVN